QGGGVILALLLLHQLLEGQEGRALTEEHSEGTAYHILKGELCIFLPVRRSGKLSTHPMSKDKRIWNVSPPGILRPSVGHPVYNEY
ncbi:MAG: hypothetical protein ABSG63_22135, partial [Spirochaetia bacterium]